VRQIQAILQAFNEIFGEGSCHIESVAVESGVPEQPFGMVHNQNNSELINVIAVYSKSLWRQPIALLVE
jgi:hypothetical protein